MAFMRWTAELLRPYDGSTVRAYVEASAKRGNAESIARLQPPPFPDALAHVWGWWKELNASRPEGMHGLAALTYPIIESWARLTGREPNPFEVETIIGLDATFRAAISAPVS